MEDEKQSEPEIINIITNQNNKNTNIYSNLSATEEINISFESKKQEKKAIICPELYKSKDIFRCHLCKELLILSLNTKNDNINIDYSCPNSHFGSIDIVLFVSKFPSFSSFHCSKCQKKTGKKKDKLYFCKDCQEVLCQKHINECKINNEYIVSIFDLDFLCYKHNKDYNSYCQLCSENLCEMCLMSNDHKNHKDNIYLFKDKLLSKEEIKKIDNLLKQGNTIKNDIKDKIEKALNIYSGIDDMSVFKNQILKKIEEYKSLVSYSYSIKKCYDLCTNLERYNHQTITNLYELFKKTEF